MRSTIVSLVLLIHGQIFAQIDLGMRAGLNISDIREKGLSFSDEDLFNPKASYHVGAYGKIPATERVFLLVETVYSRKGSRLRDAFGNRSNLRLNYLSFPVLAGLQFDDWSVVFGPQLSFSLGENSSNTDTEFSLAGGGKYYVTDKIQLGLRYVQGLSSLNNIVFTDNSGGSLGVGRLRNQVFQASLTYDFFRIE